MKREILGYLRYIISSVGGNRSNYFGQGDLNSFLRCCSAGLLDKLHFSFKDPLLLISAFSIQFTRRCACFLSLSINFSVQFPCYL